MSDWSISSDRYQRMQYRRTGRSGLKLPLISLGLWHNFGDVDRFQNMREIVFTAFDNGITHFDLANNYGPPAGSAETNFGRLLTQDLGKYRDEILVSTKAGYYMWDGPYGEWGSRKSMLSSLDQSLSRMGLDYVDIFYSHRPDPETPLEETMGALHTAVQSGKALYVGISNYDASMAKKAASILRQLGTPCLLFQGNYSMLNRHLEHEHFSIFEEEGMGSIHFSPLAQGLLTDRYINGIPERSRASKSQFLTIDRVEKELPKIQALNELARGHGCSLSQLAIAWVLRHQASTSALIGASSSKQLMENLGALKCLKISEDLDTKIEDILNCSMQ